MASSCIVILTKFPINLHTILPHKGSYQDHSRAETRSCTAEIIL